MPDRAPLRTRAEQIEAELAAAQGHGLDYRTPGGAVKPTPAPKPKTRKTTKPAAPADDTEKGATLGH